MVEVTAAGVLHRGRGGLVPADDSSPPTGPAAIDECGPDKTAQ